MPAPILNGRDLEFMLYELFNVETLTERERFQDHNRETFRCRHCHLKNNRRKAYFIPIRQKVDGQTSQPLMVKKFICYRK